MTMILKDNGIPILTDNGIPLRRCTRLLHELHALIATNNDEGGLGESIRDQMDSIWYILTDEERELLRGHSEDLYALAEGGRQPAAMSPAEVQRWREEGREAKTRYEAGEVVALLAFLRRPFPQGMPSGMIPFMQARCWQRIGDLESALVFMNEAERIDKTYSIYVLYLLEQLGRLSEAAAYAERIIDDPDATPVELYLAAGVLLSPTQHMSDQAARPVLERLVQVLRRAFQSEQAIPAAQRDIPRTEAGIASMLGLCLERVGNTNEAIRIYDQALANFPSDPELLTARGLARCQASPQSALADFVGAVNAGAQTVWPYYFLAGHSLQARDYHQAWRLILSALEMPAPTLVRAQLHEWLGICRWELGQPVDLVRESFDRAQEFDPSSQTIPHNRAIVDAAVARQHVRRPSLSVTPETQARAARRTLRQDLTTLDKLFDRQQARQLAAALA